MPNGFCSLLEEEEGKHPAQRQKLRSGCSCTVPSPGAGRVGLPTGLSWQTLTSGHLRQGCEGCQVWLPGVLCPDTWVGLNSHALLWLCVQAAAFHSSPRLCAGRRCRNLTERHPGEGPWVPWTHRSASTPARPWPPS